MPHPTERHHTYDRADRIQWRAANDDLMVWLRSVAARGGFIGSVNSDLRYYGSLTERQTTAARGFMQQDTASDSDSDVFTEAPHATRDDLPHILNGTYTITSEGEHITYRVHTVLNGPLAGKRILKLMQGYNQFAGFAFLLTDATVKVWRRFVVQEANNERFIVWGKVLMDALSAGWNASDDDIMTYVCDSGTYEIQRESRCRRCNRTLTNPSSIDEGLGSECASRDGGRTTAARHHEPLLDIPTPPTMDDLAASAEAAQEADNAQMAQGLSVETGDVLTPAQATVRDDAAQEEGVRRDRLTTLGRTRPTAAAAPDSETRLRMDALWRSLPYWTQVRTCRWCGRGDFATARGCTTHVNNYCQVRTNFINNVTADRNAARAAAQTTGQRLREADDRRAARQATGRATASALSALGTVIDGSVWPQ